MKCRQVPFITSPANFDQDAEDAKNFEKQQQLTRRQKFNIRFNQIFSVFESWQNWVLILVVGTLIMMAITTQVCKYLYPGQ